MGFNIKKYISWQFLKYGFFGIVSTIIDWSIFFLIVDIFNIVNSQTGILISSIIGAIVKFICAKHFVFNVKKNTFRQIILFIFFNFIMIFISYLIIVPINIFINFPIISRIVVTIIIFILNYIIDKFLVFVKND